MSCKTLVSACFPSKISLSRRMNDARHSQMTSAICSHSTGADKWGRGDCVEFQARPYAFNYLVHLVSFCCCCCCLFSFFVIFELFQWEVSHGKFDWIFPRKSSCNRVAPPSLTYCLTMVNISANICQDNAGFCCCCTLFVVVIVVVVVVLGSLTYNVGKTGWISIKATFTFISMWFCWNYVTFPCMYTSIVRYGLLCIA